MLLSFFMLLSVGPCVARPNEAKFVVVVDAGHGGRDAGALSKDRRYREKDIALEVSKLITHHLEASPDISVVMTRTLDRYLSLVERRRIIQSCHPDLVLSVHADSGPMAARGGAVYVLDDKGEAIVTKRIISRDSRKVVDDDVGYVLANLQQRASINYAATIAFDIQKGLGNISKPRRLKTANFALLKSPGIPSLLIEIGFITNALDVKRISGLAGQRRIAIAVAGPIRQAVKRRR